jgi:hypothetical protein|tara:strand:- start:46 stop:333 length:288 start_codon:yes stop_codon:yes gene_type:complete
MAMMPEQKEPTMATIQDQILALSLDAEFVVTFEKKDGTPRELRGRKSAPEGWTPSNDGRGQSREQLLSKGLILCTDLDKNEWRMFALDRMLTLTT